MKSFADAKGQTWTIEINVASLQRVRAVTGLDLTKLVDRQADVFPKLAGDLFVLFDVLAELLRPQLEAKEMTAEQFGESLDEESADKAAVALIEAAIDFFQEGKRMLLKRAFAKVTQAAQHRRATTLNTALQKVESPEFDQSLETALAAPTPGG
uniref:Tail assembly chaperone n=1 Tax=Schlesneria paludicola TaxID=360056 RepID=A0A7C4LIL5_9PLAN